MLSLSTWGRRRFFRRFSAHSCVTLEHLFLKRQNVDERSAENLHENLRKNLRTKNLHKNLRKNLRTKSLRKNGCKNLRTKNLRKKPVSTFCFLEDGSQRKKDKNICAKFVQNPSPNCHSPWAHWPQWNRQVHHYSVGSHGLAAVQRACSTAERACERNYPLIQNDYRHLSGAAYTIAAIPPYSAIPFRGQLDVRYPPPLFCLHGRKCQCDRGLYGGYSAIGCYTWKTKSDGRRELKGVSQRG